MKYDPEAVQRIIDLKFRIDQILLKAFKRTGMTLIKYIALIAIQKKQVLKVGDIVKICKVTNAGATIIVNFLVKKGLVEKLEIPEQDKRKKFVHITEEGENFLSRCFQIISEHLKEEIPLTNSETSVV